MSNDNSSLAGAIEAKATVTGTITVIANFAWQHLKAATLFRDQVLRLEAENAGMPFGAFFEEIRSYTSACIMSTTASLEALINELFIDPNLPLRPMFPDFEQAFWEGSRNQKAVEREGILKKYEIALSMLNVTPFNTTDQAYRDTYAVIELRNALVHYKPTWDPYRQRKVKLIELLEGKFTYSPFPDQGAEFVTMKCMSSGCANWVLATAFTFLREFDARAKLDPKKMSGFWNLDI